MQRSNHRAVLNLVGELNLIEQEHDTHTLLCRGCAKLEEELGEVARDRAFVGLAKIDRKLDAVRADHLDRLEVTESLADRHGRASAQLEASQRRLRIPRYLHHEAAVGRQLVIEAQEALGLGTILERVQQDRLADPAQPADDHALLCRATLEPTYEYAKLLELVGAASQLLRPRTGVRRVGVADRIHASKEL